MGIIKKYHDKKWTLQFLDALYNSIDSGLVKYCLDSNLRIVERIVKIINYFLVFYLIIIFI
jgi:hypothetical protein